MENTSNKTSKKTLNMKKEFFLHDDVVNIAQDLLGKTIVSNVDGIRTSGVIVETEAYKAPEDKASHAFGNKFTDRTKTLFENGGKAYIYLVYGIHHLFNIVTAKKGVAHAVLIRAIEPLENIEIMLKRRNKSMLDHSLTNGPGKLTQALGIKTDLNGIDLFDDNSLIHLEDDGIEYKPNEIIASPRVGIDYAEEYISKPWRFRVKNNIWAGK